MIFLTRLWDQFKPKDVRTRSDAELIVEAQECDEFCESYNPSFDELLRRQKDTPKQ